MESVVNIRIRENSWLARMAAMKLGVAEVALTLGNTIYLYNADKKRFLSNTRWVKHELAHVEQFRKFGLIRFTWMYLLETVKKGYHLNRFEIEARQKEIEQ